MSKSQASNRKRRKGSPAKRLSREQNDQTSTLAQVLAKATAVLDSRAEAEQWLDRPAMALDQRRPIDLLATPAGIELVEDHLERLQHGVHA